jgi:hypothetical protein
VLKNLEGNKLKILNTFIQTPNVRFVKSYVNKVWNICRMLNFTRNIKDNDHNYYLLRLKDFTCDLFITVFGSNNLVDVTLNDVFNLLSMVVDVGSNLINLKINLSNEGWIKHIDSLMKYITSKIGEIESLILIEKKFYSIFFDYLNFYLENLSSELTIDNLCGVLTLVTKVKFHESDNSTRSFFLNLLNKFKQVSASSLYNTTNFFSTFESVKYKVLLPFDITTEFYKIYIQILLEVGNIVKAELLLKEVFELIDSNTKEELEFYLVNLEIVLTYSEDNTYEKIKDILDVVLDHKELNFDHLEDIMILINNYKKYDLFFSQFINKLTNVKNVKISPGLVLSYDNIKSRTNLTVMVIYSFLKSTYTRNLGAQLQFSFIEVMKNFSNSLLDGYVTNLFSEEYIDMIPTLLKNIVIFFLKIEEHEKDSERFSNFFLLDIIKKLQKPKNTEFINIAIELYIEKRDYSKLKTIIQDIPEDDGSVGLVYFCKIIILLQDKDKWNSHNNLIKLCCSLNMCHDFHILHYLKLFKFIHDQNITDFGLISIILNHFTTVYIELIMSCNYEKLKHDNHSFIDIFYNIILVLSKIPNFNKQISHLIDCITCISDFLEFYVITNDESTNLLINEYSSVIDLVCLLIDVNKKKPGNDLFELPEFLLIACCKLINFVYLNLDTLLVYYSNLGEGQQRFKSFIEMLEIYKSLSIFYFSYEYNNIAANEFNRYKKLDDVFEKYNQIFNSSVMLLKSKTEQIDMIAIIDGKISTILNNSNTIQQIIKIKILCKTCNDNEGNLDDYIMKFPTQNIENKKFLFVISSLLYQNGLKSLCTKFLESIITRVFESSNLIGRVYSLEDIITIYKDYINLLDYKVIPLKDFTSFLLKLQGKIDDLQFNESIEWTLYRLYVILESTKTLTDKDSFVVKNIYDEINIHVSYTNKNKNKPYVLINLLELLSKKFN